MKKQLFLFLIASLLDVASFTSAQAADRYWACNSSWWDLTCWSATPGDAATLGQPQNGDNVFLTQSDAISRTVSYYNTLYPSAVLGTLRIDATGTGTMTLNQTQYNHPLASLYEYVGYNGTGSHVQSTGSNTVSGYLYFGFNSTGNGTYNLSAGSLTASNLEYVGVAGTGTFNQSGGTNTINNDLNLAINSGSNGTYTLSGGTMTVGNINNGAGSSTFNLDGGALNVTGSSIAVDTFRLGNALGSNGSFTLGSGKTLTASFEDIGYSGTGTFTQSGGTNTVSNDLRLGTNSTGNGSYNLSGGTHTVSSDLYLGFYSGSNGTYNLNAGSLTAANGYVGILGSGTFTQSGGTHTVSNDLNLATNSGSNGTYTLFGGTLNVGGNIVDGVGTSTFNLDGGTLNVTGSSIGADIFRVGNASGSNGSFTLGSSKTLMVGTEAIGYSGTGSFTQSGGTHTVSNILSLGLFGSGTYTLSGGTLNVGNIVNGAGTSTFNLDGGTLNVTGSSIAVDTFRLGNALGSNGSFTLGGGKTLTTGTEIIGNLGTGSFIQTGGANTAGTLTINNGTYALYGGSLIAGNMYNNGILYLAGGTLSGNGALVNNNLVSGYGAISTTGIGSGFVNNALLTQSGGHLTLTNTGSPSVHDTNNGNIDLATGYQLRLNGATLDNGGTINLNSAVVTGTGTLNNTYGGVIAGRGTISSNFSNSGGVVALTSGATNITNAFSNSGAIQLGGPTASLVGGVITNTGTIEGVGNVGNSIGNTGIVRADAGTLTLSGASVGNNTGGLMTAPAGGTILAANGMSTNAGTINMTGGAFDNNNHALTNTGQISGYGTLRTGGLSNQGTMTITGGTTTVNGNLTNAAGANLNVAHNPAIFTGTVVNNGTVKTTQTTVTFAGSYTENGTFISDPSNNYFTNVVIGTNGYWTGGVGDNFFISGNFENHSLQNTLWNTNAASLLLNGSGTQNLYLAGGDLGAILGGYNNNFAWGEFSLGSGVSAHLWDGNADPSAALYVGLVELGGGLGQIGSIYSDFNIYYDPTLTGNAYLGGKSFALNGAGLLMPVSAVPVPPAVWLFGSGLLGLVGVARCRK